jgi:hypothetical protein
MARHDYRMVDTMSKWHSIEEGFPKGEVLLLYCEGFIIEGWYDEYWKFATLGAHGCGCCYEHSVPTHWMKLPPKPGDSK